MITNGSTSSMPMTSSGTPHTTSHAEIVAAGCRTSGTVSISGAVRVGRTPLMLRHAVRIGAATGGYVAGDEELGLVANIQANGPNPSQTDGVHLDLAALDGARGQARGDPIHLRCGHYPKPSD
ncbi:hypothetical protein A1Q2_00282 [Trichosporon asahii var. asahii CBS 8904]|uniref:Uncharacterized protein n=1 Tax=Trichosporon asahii var. asahii (strain CBS 8904) TaxID=1220162 RepID=K1VY46_TRIAC|nr:hypothetical protein A1Q2_00282 [Trichosporon asahii var. asahii CBS 8904]